MLNERRPRVFLCHCSADKPGVRAIYERLQSWGCDAWLDERELKGGQDWDLEIRRAVRASDIVVVCLSRASIAKSGYVQKELRFALDIAEEQPEGTIFLIPVKLEECDVPDRLLRLQWIDLRAIDGYERLRESIGARFSVVHLLERNPAWAHAAINVATRWDKRMTAFRQEKDFLAEAFVPMLLQRCRELAQQGENIHLVLDAGTTVAALFAVIARSLASQAAETPPWPTLVTNNLAGVEEYLSYGRLSGTNQKFPQCHVLSGSISIKYHSIGGVETNEALQRYFDSHCGHRFIGVSAAPWVVLSSPQGPPVPVARAAGATSFKETLIQGCEETYIVSPLGKLWCASLPEINAISIKDDPRFYEQPAIPREKWASVHLVTTGRSLCRALGAFSAAVCARLNTRPMAPSDAITLPGHVVLEYDNLPVTFSEQIELELPMLRDSEIRQQFFLIEES